MHEQTIHPGPEGEMRRDEMRREGRKGMEGREEGGVNRYRVC